jgi:FtsP/CotA-like multicopper oxidase with cupredoxin domain
MGMMHGRMGGRRVPAGGEPLLEPVYDAYAVNGRIAPRELAVKQGDRVKLRIANPSSATMYDLRLAGHTLVITHLDGRPVEPVQTDILRIGMGERYDVEFLADNPGFWLMSAYDRGRGEGQIRIPVKYKGARAPDPTPPSFHDRLRFAAYRDFRTESPQRESKSAPPDQFFPQMLSGGMHSPYWGINGQYYPEAETLSVRMGDRVRMGYWNHSVMPHPMHLHGHFFRLVNKELPADRWIYKDTVIVNPMERVEIEFVADNPGKWFHHCHNLYHMMAGMANVVEVR